MVSSNGLLARGPFPLADAPRCPFAPRLLANGQPPFALIPSLSGYLAPSLCPPPRLDALRWLLSLVRLIDVVEVGLVAYLLYRLYRLMQGTIAVQIFFGLLALLGIQAVVTALDLTILRAFFDTFSSIFAVALVVLFQPELRRLLLIVGQNPLIRRIVSNVKAGQSGTVEVLAEAALVMSRKRMGALIAIERTAGLRHFAETGTRLGARLDADLLVTIFYGQNPLHDGAVIVRGDVIEAARCILPVTQQDLDPHLGLRHRAAVGLTEQTDAVCLVVSEETGAVSVAVGGVLRRFPGGEGFRRYLDEVIGTRADVPEAAVQTVV